VAGLTVDQFIQRYREFTRTPRDTLQVYLNEALPLVNADRFKGELFLKAHGLQTAKILGQTPYGQNARLTAKGTETVYDKAWETFAKSICSGPIII
jgi:hypothetical protein